LVVLGCGQRCGSTLVQRLLCSHPEVMIWGEHDGQLASIMKVAEQLEFWAQTYGAVARNELSAYGYHGFIANLTPESDRVGAAVRAFVDTLFAAPASELGRPVWGFKEVRYGLTEIQSLARIFAGIRVVVVVRDPRDVLCSLNDWEHHPGWTRRDTEKSLGYWRSVAASFADGVVDHDLCDRVLSVRYEDLVAEPDRWSAAIAEHCGLGAAELDRAVFDVRVRNALGQGPPPADLRTWDELTPDMRALLDDEEIVSVAGSYGYDLT
jgi:hypothetical protein